jgi:type II secretory pathway pseudopilin PulG
MIELLIVIAIIGILATTLAPKLRKLFGKAKVAKVKHKLGLIRSKLSIDSNFSDEFPDLVSNDDNLLNQFDVHPTEAFSYYDGSYGETDIIVESRDDSGGWFYNKTTGEIYANLPNGAYTYDKVYEIWNEEFQSLIDSGAVDSDGKYINNSNFGGVTTGTYTQVNSNQIDFWNATDPKETIEIWKNGFNQVSSIGDYFIELNSNKLGSIYQDLETVPGTTLVWSVNHRGRSGEDTATLSAGNSESATLDIQQTMTDGNEKWGTYTYEYVVPEGQTTTRFSIDSISSTGPDSYGNFLDNFTVKVK